MRPDIDHIAEGFEEYEDLMRDSKMKDFPGYHENFGRYGFSFELDAVERGVKAAPEVRDTCKRSYLNFLDKVYKKAGYADEASGKGSSKKQLGKWRQQIEDEMLQAAAMMGGGDSSWYSSPKGHGLPDAQLFEKMIMPCVEAIAETPEQVVVVFEDALACLEDLMFTKFISTSSRGVGYGFYQSFFHHPGTAANYYRHAASENFFDYYTLYGRKFALLIAAVQGKEEDRHYDGGSYSFPNYRLNRMFLSPLERIDRKYHDEILDVAIHLARTGGYSSVGYFFEHIPAVIEAFEKEEQPQLLADYFELARHNRMEIREYNPQLPPVAESAMYFLLDGKESVQQMRALQGFGNLKPAVIKSAGFILDNVGLREISVDFAMPPRRPSFNFDRLLKDYKSEGRTTIEIEKILGLCEKNPWLRDLMPQILENYSQYESTQPGGVAGMIQRLGKIQSSYYAMAKYAFECTKYPWDNPDIDKCLDIGERITAIFGSGTDWFYKAENIKIISEQITAGKLERIEMLIEKLQAIAEESAWFKSSYVLARFAEVCFTRLLDDPRLESLLEAVYTIAHTNTDGGERKDYFAEISLLTGMEFLLAGCLDKWKGENSYRALDCETTCIRDTEMVSSAKILGDYICTHQALTFRDDNFVFDLIRMGYDPRMALDNSYAGAKRFEQHYDNSPDYNHLKYLCDLREAEGPEAVVELVKCIFDSRQAIRNTLTQGTQSAFLLPEKVDTDASLSAADLRKQIDRIEKLMASPHYKDSTHLLGVKRELEQALELHLLRSVVQGAPTALRQKNVSSHLLENGNDTTKILLTGTSLLAAAGVLDLPGIQMPQLPEGAGLRRLLLTSENNDNRHLLPEALNAYRSSLEQRTSEILPQIERLILAARDEAPGLMAEGGKIHTLGTINEDLVVYLRSIFGLGSTPFSLIHSGQTLLLPPAPTAFELQLLIAVLSRFGVMNTDSPDLQVAMAGRLPEKLAAISGISVLLSTDVGVKYAQGAFSTTHDEATGARIMAYDAGVKVQGLPYDRPDTKGRTDMLGRRSLLDIHHYRVVHTLLTDVHLGGPFMQIGREYVVGFNSIMRKYGLNGLLDATSWIYNPDNLSDKKDTSSNHETVVGAVTEAWFKATSMSDFGLIGDIRRLIDDSYDQMKALREKIIAADKDEYHRYMSF